MYEVFIPDSEKQFLGTTIDRVLIETYKKHIFAITIFPQNDIKQILENMFTREKVGDNQYSIYIPKFPTNYYEDYFKNSFDKTSPILKRSGRKIELEYGALRHLKTGGTSFSEISAYYLRIHAKNYKYPIDSKMTNEHSEAFLSDFGVKYYPEENNAKNSYTIPLFEINNTFYVRALFNDFVDNLIFDTGADQLIISKNLYKKLTAKNLVIENNSKMKMQVASGETISLQKVILKSIQLNDLYVENVEAYVNTSDDISLLGQSFLKRFGRITVDHKLNLLIVEK